MIEPIDARSVAERGVPFVFYGYRRDVSVLQIYGERATPLLLHADSPCNATP